MPVNLHRCAVTGSCGRSSSGPCLSGAAQPIPHSLSSATATASCRPAPSAASPARRRSSPAACLRPLPQPPHPHHRGRADRPHRAPARSASTKTSPKPSPWSTTSATRPSATPENARWTSACKRHGLRFDHNLHALRIVEHFEQRYAALRGLNLTLGVREGIVKHSRDYTADSTPSSPTTFWASARRSRPRSSTSPTRSPTSPPTSTTASSPALLEIGHIRQHVEILSRCYTAVETAARRRRREIPLQRSPATHAEHPHRRPHRHHAQKHHLHGCQLPRRHSRLPRTPRRFSAQVESERLQEKRYLYDTLYTCRELEIEHSKAEEVVTALFNYWIEDPEELPPSYFEEVQTEGLARTIADYIAGMTDSFIFLQYAAVKRTVRR